MTSPSLPSTSPGAPLRSKPPPAGWPKLFGVTLRTYDDGHRRFRARVGRLMVPREIAPWTRAIIGFDQRPLAAAPVDRLQALALTGNGPGLWPTEIAALYGIPLDRDVASVCVGIVALGGGYLPSDLKYVYHICSFLPVIGLLTAFLPNIEERRR